MLFGIFNHKKRFYLGGYSARRCDSSYCLWRQTPRQSGNSIDRLAKVDVDTGDTKLWQQGCYARPFEEIALANSLHIAPFNFHGQFF